MMDEQRAPVWRCRCGALLKGGGAHMDCPADFIPQARRVAHEAADGGAVFDRDNFGMEVVQFSSDDQEIAALRAEVVRLRALLRRSPS